MHIYAGAIKVKSTTSECLTVKPNRRFGSVYSTRRVGNTYVYTEQSKDKHFSPSRTCDRIWVLAYRHRAGNDNADQQQKKKNDESQRRRNQRLCCCICQGQLHEKEKLLKKEVLIVSDKVEIDELILVFALLVQLVEEEPQINKGNVK